jgi:pyruvate,orthophosphate dikinase
LASLKRWGELPVVIRTIDPPLHEFLPSHEQLLVEVTELRVRGDNPELLKEKEEMLKAVEQMREANPMLGLRGCRLGIMMPQITVMQTRAIIEAACILKKRGVNVHPEIMIPTRRARERTQASARGAGSRSEKSAGRARR